MLKAYPKILLVLAMIIILLSCSQGNSSNSSPNECESETSWQKTFGGARYEIGHSLQQTRDGGYIVTALTVACGVTDTDIWVIKMDSEGNREWSKLLGDYGMDYGQAIRQTTDDGYVIAGSTNSYGSGSIDAWLIKIDNDGNMKWNKTFDRGSSESSSSVLQTVDGGYIMLGSTATHGYDALLIKTDSKGNEEWMRTFGGPDWKINDYGIQQTIEGGFIIIGSIQPTNRESYEDVWLLKTDAQGNEEWMKTYGGTEWDTGHSVRQTKDGGYIVAGRTASFGSGKEDVWLIKTDSDGNKVWDKTIGGEESDSGKCIQPTKDGGFIIGGQTASSGAAVTEVWLIKTDSEGNKEWDKTFDGGVDGIAWNDSSIIQTCDGGYAMIGMLDDNIRVLKTDSNGNAPALVSSASPICPDCSSISYNIHYDGPHSGDAAIVHFGIEGIMLAYGNYGDDNSKLLYEIDLSDLIGEIATQGSERIQLYDDTIIEWYASEDNKKLYINEVEYKLKDGRYFTITVSGDGLLINQGNTSSADIGCNGSGDIPTPLE